jgi:hypothetical protein
VFAPIIIEVVIFLIILFIIGSARKRW